MKYKKKWVVLAIVLAVAMSIMMIPMIAAGDEVSDDDSDSDGPEVGPMILDSVAITYNHPTTGDTAGEINKSFSSKNNVLKFKDITWRDSNASPMESGDAFKGGSKYELYLTLCITGGYLTEDTIVTVNGEKAKYDSGLTKAATPDGATPEGYMANSVFILEVTPDSLPSPKAVFKATGTDTGVLSGVDSSMQYSRDGGASWMKCTKNSIELTGLSEGEIQVCFIADTANIQSIKIERFDAPSGLKAVNCSTSDNNNGKITGAKESMEYRADGKDAYTACKGSEIKNLAPGKYYVRYAAAKNKLSSGDTAVDIAEYKATVPRITKQPTSETIKAGESCKYTVKGEGIEKYEWHVIDVQDGKDYIIDPVEDKKYYKGIGTEALTVLSVKDLEGECDCEYSGDQYYCVVSNEAGNTTSSIVDYIVKHAPATDEWKCDSSNHWQVCFCGTIINKAEHQDQDKDEKCDVCKFDMSKAKAFHILEGANSTWNGGSSDPLVIKADGEIKEFKELEIDESKVDSDDYDLTEGSTIVAIHPECLNKLENGDHTVSFIYDNGSVSTQLSVVEKEAKASAAVTHDIAKKCNTAVLVFMVVTFLLIATIITLSIALMRSRRQ